MMNNFMCVGRLVTTPEIKELEDGKKVTNITVAIPRSYKNADGEYETDFVDCTLWNNIAQSTTDYCKTGDVIGVRGRVESRLYEKDDGTKQKIMTVVADRITFLSSSKEKTQNQDELEVD